MKQRFRRGRRVLSGLAAVAVAAACGEPVAEAVSSYEAPLRQAGGDGVVVTNHGPAERLIIRPPAETGGSTLLFLGGRAATPLPGGGSAWADLEGGRVVTFDSRGRVDAVLGGPPREGPTLARPAFVAADATGLLAVEIDGQALRFVEGGPDRWVETGLPGAAVGGTPGALAATRTVFDIHLAPLAPNEPLLWVSDAHGVRAVGRVDMPEQAVLAPVVNAGWVAPAADAVVFASAVRPELRRYRADGALSWIATWPRPGIDEPRLVASAGTVLPQFRLVQQAVAVGPDGRIYVLVTTGDEGPADRVLVFEADGTLLRAGDVPVDAAIYVGRRGHVYALAGDRALSRTGDASPRTAFEPFDLPALDGPGRVSLEAHSGKVVVVNFWASWCAPCRREMPLLDRFAHEVDPERVVVIGLNEDVSPSAGAAFLREIGGVGYPVAEGGGSLRERYGYRGLPYTVVLDARGRVVRAIYGFGDSIDPIREAVDEALGSGREPLR